MDRSIAGLAVRCATGEHGHNAWVIDDAGTMAFSFSIGDAIEDVLANGNQIVATYFDEGVFGNDPLSQNGIGTFTPRGGFFGDGTRAPLSSD
jgi:hypothetical protein